jgi:hypothetical protein
MHLLFWLCLQLKIYVNLCPVKVKYPVTKIKGCICQIFASGNTLKFEILDYVSTRSILINNFIDIIKVCVYCLPDWFYWVLHVMSLIDENLSMKASLSPVLERMIEHAPHIYMIPLPKIYLFSSTPWPGMEVNALMKWDQMVLATHSVSWTRWG